VRTTDDRAVDIGASYFTVSDPRFQAVVDQWASRGLARPWTDTFSSVSPDAPTLSASSGPMRWSAPGGLRSLVEQLARGLDVTQRTIAQITPGADGGLLGDGVEAPAIVLAMPDPQASRLLHPSLAGDAAVLDQTYDPVLALTAAWSVRSWAEMDGVFVNGDADLSFIADDGRRRGDGAPVLVAHSTSTLAAAHLDDPTAAQAPLLAAMRRVLSIDSDPTWTSVHRWTFAKPSGTRAAPYYLSAAGLGFCGDGWSERPRVEAAYLSGRELGEALATRLA
jgi:renalase